MRWITIAVSIVFLFVVTLAVFILPSALLGGGKNFAEAQGFSYAMPLVCAALMLVGVLFGALYSELQNDNLPPSSALTRAFARPGLYRALLISPIVFSGVYSFVQTSDDFIIVAVFAFQNGFFCEAIFRKQTANLVDAGDAT